MHKNHNCFVPGNSPHPFSAACMAFLAIVLAAHHAPAQQAEQKPVPTGKGSYADGPPLADPKFAAKYLNQPPAPKGTTSVGGLKTSVLNWGDWTVVVRQEQEKGYWDITFGHGLPFIWIECAGLQPSLRGKSLEAQDMKGGALGGAATDALIVKVEGQAYGIFGPGGMSVTSAADSLDIHFSDPAKGTVTTTFELKTEALRKDAGKPLQGWIPHHFRTVSNNIKTVGTPYVSPRGPLRLSEGSVFHLEYSFPGLLPFFSAPKVVASEKNPYDPVRMSGYLQGLDEARTNKPPANDTYWGGKDIQKVAQFAAIASQMKDPSAGALQEKLRGYLADWFTYDGPGDKHYFAYYPGWKALVGFPPSFGSDFFTDNHFHYGYFTMSAGLCGIMDPGFAFPDLSRARSDLQSLPL